MLRTIPALLIALPLLSACSESKPPAPPEPRPVWAITVEPRSLDDVVRLSGEVQAQKEVSLAFRIGGRMTERAVNVGDAVKAGQVVARLDAKTEENALHAAEAALAAAYGQVGKARNVFDRQARLMEQGFTTRPRYDEARQALNTAQAALEDAEAQLELARDRVAFTELRADAGGVVTARGAEPGEVVQAGQMVLQVARRDGRDAVFDVPARLLHAAPGDPVIEVSLLDNPSVKAIGRVREVAPQADPVTRTFRVRVGLDDPPEAMALGGSVVGSMKLQSDTVLAVPAGALTMAGRSPAVWLVDPATSTVSLRPIDVLRFGSADVVVYQGLEPGDVIVTAGIQALHPGQKVRILTEGPAEGARAASAQASGGG
jgi:RND family efflux transporter MFP subunit